MHEKWSLSLPSRVFRRDRLIQQFGEPDADIAQDGPPVLEIAVQVVGDGFEAVKRKVVHPAEERGGIGLHVEEVVLAGELLHLLRGEGLGAQYKG